MRTIDADALLTAYDAKHKGPPGNARRLIETAPTIDAIPVEWMHGLMNILVTGDSLEQGQALFLSNMIEAWQKEQEA